MKKTPEEQWRDVPGFEGIYAVSTMGRIYSYPQIIPERVWTPGAKAQKDTYPGVSLKKNGVRKTYQVHRLIAWAFIGPQTSGLVVRHKNDIPSDCRLDNLEYGTHADNMQDMIRNGHHVNQRKTHCLSGHQYGVDDTRATEGRRQCRVCVRISGREERKENKVHHLSPFDVTFTKNERKEALQIRAEEMRESYNSGLKVEEVSRQFGVSTMAVYYALKKLAPTEMRKRGVKAKGLERSVICPRCDASVGAPCAGGSYYHKARRLLVAVNPQ